MSLTDFSSTVKEKYPVDKWDGAVIILMVEDHIVYIQRSETMPSHKGQIGFMGGHKHQGELTPIMTAKREFEEESSISSSLLEVLGLGEPVFATRSNQRLIIPVIAQYKGSIESFLGQVESNGEWENMVLAPVDYLKKSNMWSKLVVRPSRIAVFFHPLSKYECIYLNTDIEKSSLLWGASAKMTLNFFKNYFEDGSK